MTKHSQRTPIGGRRRKPSQAVPGRWTKRDTQTGRRMIHRRSEGAVPSQGIRITSSHRPVRPQTDHINTMRNHRQRVRNALVRAGLSVSNPAPLTHARPLTDEQRKILARQVARGRPLSEYIMDERKDR
jgi:hypothetical protein